MARNLDDTVGRIKGNFDRPAVDDGVFDVLRALDVLEEGVIHSLGDGSNDLLLLVGACGRVRTRRAPEDNNEEEEDTDPEQSKDNRFKMGAGE